MPSDLVQKAVFGRAGNRCAFGDCSELLIVDDQGSTTVVGELAHIVAKSVQGPRGHLDVDPEDRESPANYIALCRKHHKVIDSNPLVYSVPVLRAMKEARERPFTKSDPTLPATREVSETLHSTMLWVQALPSRVFTAPTGSSFEDVINGMSHPRELTPFVLRDNRLWTFHPLDDVDGPFSAVVDQRSVAVKRADAMWSDPDDHRMYVNLLNRAVTQHLGRKGLRYDREHRRHFFAAKVPGEPVEWTYQAKAGRSQTREVVREAKFKDGTPKGVWWHLAVRFRFEQVGPLSWYATLRPEFHLTKDGVEPLESQRIGRRVTREKSTLYNGEYLNLVHFWRCVLSGEKPRTVLHAGQPIVIDTHLADAVVSWPGIRGDEAPFIPDPFPDDLFTIAEMNEVDESETSDPFDVGWDDPDQDAEGAP